jgi:phosphate:Na+ symporter
LISPSSSAIAVLSVQILNQSALTAGRMLAVVLGANVGLTVIVQLITFDLQNFAGAFIVAGGIGFLFLQRAIFRGTGQIFLGLGFIFLAMSIISNTGKLAATSQDTKALFSIVEHYPWLVFVTTGLLALVLQSSTACIGLGIGLAKGGLVTGAVLVPWVLGANLGIGPIPAVGGTGRTRDFSRPPSFANTFFGTKPSCHRGIPYLRSLATDATRCLDDMYEP